MKLPLSGVRVVEFAHMVMGPVCGMVLADLGAEVIKVEPVAGDNTRALTGSGAGFFAAFNRNKKSVALDLHDADARAAVLRLIAQADIVTENFRPGAMDKLGLGYAQLQQTKPELIYVSHKGFLSGPYEQRAALDEVVQMMAGLAYMTGPPGKPLRAGASVNDIMGGVFAALGAVAALYERKTSGRGKLVESALFENCALLVTQHMLQSAITNQPAAPMPARVSAWGLYDVFTLADNSQLFIAVVSDTQWRALCEAVRRSDWLSNKLLATNTQRVTARPWLLPQVEHEFRSRTQAQMIDIATRAGLPWAPVAKPDDLFADEHLNASGGLAPMQLPDGTETKVPLLPLALDGARLPKRLDPPRVGEHTREVLQGVGLSLRDVDALIERGVAANVAAGD